MILDALARLLEEHPIKAHPGHGWPCCELVARVILGSRGVPLEGDWHPGRRGGPPAGRWWAEANIHDPARPWSVPRVYVDAGLAYAFSEGGVPFRPGRWYPCQGWRRLTPEGHVEPGDGRVNGHTWLWYAVDETHGIALESSVTRGMRLGGVSCAAMGEVPALSDLRPHPWADRIAPYAAGVAVAVLRPVADHHLPRAERVNPPLARRLPITPPRIDLDAIDDVLIAQDALTVEPSMSDPIRPASLAALPQALAGVDLDRLAERAVRAAQGLVGDGPARHRRAVRLLAQELDEAIEWGPGPAGRIAEALDGPVLQLLLGGIVRAAYERLTR